MQTAVLIVVVAICAIFIVRHMLRSLGIGTGSGKPDCGCGHCSEKGISHDQNR